MKRWTPFSVYLVVLAYTTALVISAGTFAVQCWSEWPTIRGTGTLQPTPHLSSQNARSVKPDHHLQCPVALIGDNPSPRGECPLNALGPAMASMDQARVTLWRDTDFAYSSSVTGREWTPSRGTLRSDWDREPRLSKQGVQAIRGGAAWRGLGNLGRPDTRGAGGVERLWPDHGRRKDVAGIGSGHHLESLVKAAAGLCGVDKPLAWSLALRESSGKHWDASGAVLRSSAGAVGVLQIKPSTARGVASDLDVMQPWGNALAALCHFRRLLDKARGDRHLALRWYHRGEYARGPVPQATHDYATDIIEGSN